LSSCTLTSAATFTLLDGASGAQVIPELALSSLVNTTMLEAALGALLVLHLLRTCLLAKPLATVSTASSMVIPHSLTSLSKFLNNLTNT
jgi:hypothetical protein